MIITFLAKRRTNLSKAYWMQKWEVLSVIKEQQDNSAALTTFFLKLPIDLVGLVRVLVLSPIVGNCRKSEQNQRKQPF